MLYLLSPAKTLDYATAGDPALAARATRPAFVARAAELIEILQAKTPAQLASLMSLSDPLAALNAARYAAWRPRFTAHNSKPAIEAFRGDVYLGLDAPTLSADDLDWAQQHLLILSGLYGLLRPLDRLQPYRLEMGTRLQTPKGRHLYDFWGELPARELNRRLRGARVPVVVNLASQEYARAVDRRVLKAPVIDCVFEDWKDGRYQIISFFAKRARGLMARHAIVERLTDPAGLDDFDADGYRLDTADSTPQRRVFRRRVAP